MLVDEFTGFSTRYLEKLEKERKSNIYLRIFVIFTYTVIIWATLTNDIYFKKSYIIILSVVYFLLIIIEIRQGFFINRLYKKHIQIQKNFLDHLSKMKNKNL